MEPGDIWWRLGKYQPRARVHGSQKNWWAWSRQWADNVRLLIQGVGGSVCPAALFSSPFFEFPLFLMLLNDLIWKWFNYCAAILMRVCVCQTVRFACALPCGDDLILLHICITVCFCIVSVSLCFVCVFVFQVPGTLTCYPHLLSHLPSPCVVIAFVHFLCLKLVCTLGQ